MVVSRHIGLVLIVLGAMSCHRRSPSSTEGAEPTDAEAGVDGGREKWLLPADWSSGLRACAGSPEPILLNSERHCGQCGRVCATGEQCRAGTCVPEGQVSMSASHACHLRQSGTVRCWGANSEGELGDGSTTPRPRAVRVRGLEDIVEIGTGRQRTCALRKDGAVLCWGATSIGKSNRLPTAVPGISDGARLAVGERHVCALRRDGHVVCWGNNSDGQLGDGTNKRSDALVSVAGVEHAIDVTAGADFSCALIANGAITCWGTGRRGELALFAPPAERYVPRRVTIGELVGALRLVASGNNVCAIGLEGRAVCWGEAVASAFFGGIRDAWLAGLVPIRGLGPVIDIAPAGWNEHNCAVLARGEVQCWEPPSGSESEPVVPVRPTNPGVHDAIGIATTSVGACALTRGDEVDCWGPKADASNAVARILDAK